MPIKNNYGDMFDVFFFLIKKCLIFSMLDFESLGHSLLFYSPSYFCLPCNDQSWHAEKKKKSLPLPTNKKNKKKWNTNQNTSLWIAISAVAEAILFKMNFWKVSHKEL